MVALRSKSQQRPSTRCASWVDWPAVLHHRNKTHVWFVLRNVGSWLVSRRNLFFRFPSSQIGYKQLDETISHFLKSSLKQNNKNIGNNYKFDSLTIYIAHCLTDSARYVTERVESFGFRISVLRIFTIRSVRSNLISSGSVLDALKLILEFIWTSSKWRSIFWFSSRSVFLYTVPWI